VITSKEIGKIFAEERKRRNLSIEDVRRRSRIQPSVIKDIENGVFDRLGKPYLKGFLKKYSTLLGLDTEDVLKKYEEVSAKIPGPEFSLERGRTEEEDEFFAARMKKRLKITVVTVFSVVIAVLFFMLLGAIRSKIMRQPAKKRVVVTKARKKPAPSKKTVKQKKPPSARPAKSAAAKTAVVLTIRSNGTAWLQVNEGKKMLFAGIMEAGETKTWKAGKDLNVWTGKADVLDFTVNKRKIGMVAAGVVRNINVSSKGVKVGKVWAARLE